MYGNPKLDLDMIIKHVDCSDR